MGRAKLSWMALSLFFLFGCAESATQPETVTFDGETEFFLAEAGASQDATPSERAGAAVAFAREFLAAAVKRIGGNGSAEVQALLAAAEGSCVAAEGFLSEERWLAAARAARGCAMSAREAMHQAHAERKATLEAQVNEAIAMAGGLVAQAAALVGADAPDAAKEALARAQTSLGEAAAALEAGRLREAMLRARVAGALAQRIIKALG